DCNEPGIWCDGAVARFESLFPRQTYLGLLRLISGASRARIGYTGGRRRRSWGPLEKGGSDARQPSIRLGIPAAARRRGARRFAGRRGRGLVLGSAQPGGGGHA